MNYNIELLPPMMPDFISIKTPPGSRQDGINFENNKIPVSQLTTEQAEEYAELMKQTFIQHHKELSK